MNTRSHICNIDESSNKQDSLFLKCFIQNVQINCLIDTGSTVCVLHPRKYNFLPENEKSKLEKHNKKLCMANGDTVMTYGCINLPISIGNDTFYQNFIIADVDVPAVIGYDFMHANKCKLDIGSGKIILKGNEYSCVKGSNMPSLFKISVTEKLTIPPNSEVITKGSVIGDSSHIVNALVEPLPFTNTSDILIAKSLVDPSNGLVPLRIANISDEEVTLYKNTCTASCEQVDLIDNEYHIDNPSHENENEIDIPSHLENLYEKSSTHLEKHECKVLQNLLLKHKDTFSKDKSDLGRATAIKHKINTGNASPIKQQPRRPLSLKERQ